MELSIKTYLDKMRGCWLGKNVGGTLGTPFECKQGAIDLDYYTHDLSQGVLPNDDLDLQLVWLIACEAYGKKVNAEILANYWISHIYPDWSEYGMAKRNLRAGILPAASGKYHNSFGESNGAWIRSEIWACLAPGHPEIAVRYAYEDACVDHYGEGIYAEIFCAAIQSAAFVESNMETLINIALTYIPKDCAVAGAVAYIRELAKDETLDWKAARKKFLQKYPSSFGNRPLPGEKFDPEIPFGTQGYDAASNIGLMLLGHYFGGGDFSRAICITAGCCEDADCTAGTLAALYGIIGGTACIDEKWLTPIGDEIKTKSVDRSKLHCCGTVTELTNRILHLMPGFMTGYYKDGKNTEWLTISEDGEMKINVREGMDLSSHAFEIGFHEIEWFRNTLHADRICIRRESPFFNVCALMDTLDIEEDKPLEIDLDIVGKFGYFQRSDWNEVIVHVPEDWEVIGGRETMFTMQLPWHPKTFKTGIIPHNLKGGRYDATIEIRLGCFPSRIYIPLTFMRTLQEK